MHVLGDRAWGRGQGLCMDGYLDILLATLVQASVGQYATVLSVHISVEVGLYFV